LDKSTYEVKLFIINSIKSEETNPKNTQNILRKTCILAR